MESRYLADNDLFERMLSVEDALIDAYVQGELSDNERKKVETFLLRSDGRDREINFVRNLIADLARLQSAAVKSASVSEDRPSKWRSLLTLMGLRSLWKRYSFALVFILLIGSGLAIWNIALNDKIARLEAKQLLAEKSDQELRDHIEAQAERNEALARSMEEERNIRHQLEEELADLQESKTLIRPNDIAIISLTMDSFSRSVGKLPVFYLREGAKRLQINIDVDDESDYKSYNAEIKTFEGREVWREQDLRVGKAKPGKVTLALPARIFTNEDYTLSLKGLTQSGNTIDMGEYSFRIVK